MDAIIDTLRRQLAAHGYYLTDDELRDCAAHVAMAVAEPSPIATALNGLLAINAHAGRSIVNITFWGDEHPGASKMLREWASEHSEVVSVREGSMGEFYVERRDNFAHIATWYPRAHSEWSVAQHSAEGAV